MKYFKHLERYLLRVPRSTRAHVGCLIVYRGVVIAIGHNQLKSHPLQAHYKNYRIYLHAEVDALRKALRVIHEDDLMYCKVYVLRLKYSDTGWIQAMAKPCMDCMSTLVNFGVMVDNISWTTET